MSSSLMRVLEVFVATICARRTPFRAGEAESGAFAVMAVGASFGRLEESEDVNRPSASSPQVPNL